MIDDDLELKKRFQELRSQEVRFTPRFAAKARPRTRIMPARLAAVAAALAVVLVGIGVGVRDQVLFDATDRLAVRSANDWQSPTDFLLKTPGNELISTTPTIPDPAVKGLLP
jgi:hypothetical protein